MKKNYKIILFIIFVLIGGYFVLTGENGIKNQIAAEPTTEVYSNPDIGLEFDFKTGTDGYGVVEMDPQEGEKEFLKSVILMQAEDVANMDNMPEGGEGPPIIAALVFKNIKKLSSSAWVAAYPNFSNIAAKQGELMDVVVGGANGVRYKADGLYASEIFVVAHGDNVYVFVGMYIDEESEIRKDFVPIVESVRFIPLAVPGAISVPATPTTPVVPAVKP